MAIVNDSYVIEVQVRILISITNKSKISPLLHLAPLIEGPPTDALILLLLVGAEDYTVGRAQQQSSIDLSI